MVEEISMADEAPTTARLEAFSDGVIAVIITVMVLEIKVPHADGLKGLRDLAPGLAIYLVSFAFTGIYWLNHQHILRRTEAGEHWMQCANLGFLFCLSLIPFSTAYVVDKELSGFAVATYAASLLIVGFSFLWLRLAVYAQLKRHGKFTHEDHKGFKNHLLSLAVYACSTAAAVFYPRSVLGFMACLTFVWALPNMSFSLVKRQYS
jgi:uncharacterized membrane protein